MTAGRALFWLLTGLILTIVGTLVWLLVQMAAHAQQLQQPLLPEMPRSTPTTAGRATVGDAVALPKDRRASRSRTTLAAGVNTGPLPVKDGQDGPRTGALAVPAPAAHTLNWSALAECESTGNPRAVSPSGKYRGLYQFSQTTWESVGGQGDPIDASPAEQTHRAQLLYARDGRAPWPVCGRHL